MNTNAPTKTSSFRNHRLLYISKRKDAASTRYRIFQFFPALENKGWHCDYIATNQQSLWERLQFAIACRHYSVVIIQRKLFDSFTLHLISFFNANIVFDYDDAIFLNDNGNPSSRRLKRFNKITHLAKASLAGNTYLASHSQSKLIEVLPTSIPFEDYQKKQHIREQYLNSKLADKSKYKSLTLVWIGSHSTKKYLESHREVIEAIGEKIGNVTFKIIGDFSITFNHINTLCIDWSADTEIEELMTADIGIAPMDEDPWTKGKCALKIIQYMACGLPVISSNTGANAEIVVQESSDITAIENSAAEFKDTGFLANDLPEWINSIEKLSNETLRLSMGANALKRVAENYTVDKQAARMDKLFKQLVDS
ncbi:MAG: glycosyltransferase family 4 protein [Cellvibrionaceae bacterium]